MTLLRYLPLVFSLALPLAAQTEIPITTPTRDPAVGNQQAPRAASLGDRGLVVWGEGLWFGSAVPRTLRAARIDGDGKLLDGNALIIDRFPDFVQPLYDVAASGDRFLVAYSDFDLKVRSVGRDGTLGDPLMLGTFAVAKLRIAASNDGNRFLVVWSDSDLHAVLFDRDAQPLGANIDLGAVPTGLSSFALVPRGNGFALIAHTGDAIIALTLDANAHVTGERTLANDVPAYFPSVNAAANGDQVWIIAGTIELQWAPTDVVSRGPLSGNALGAIGDSAIATYESNGIALHDLSSPATTTIEVRPPHSVQNAAIMRLTGGIYTAFTADDGLQQTDIFGALNSGPIDTLATSPSFQTAPAIASDAAGKSLVIWLEYSTRARVWRLLGRVVDRTGVPIGDVTTVASEVPDSGFIFGPRVTSDGSRFLVTYGVSTIPSTVYGQFVSNGGSLTGDPFIVTQSALGGFLDVTWNGQRYLVTWVEGMVFRFTSDEYAVGAFVGNDRSVSSPFRITSGQAQGYSQASSPAGDTLLTAYAANGFASYIVHSDGAIGGPYFAVAPGASTPVVAWSGSAFVAAWSANGKLQTGVIHPDGSTTVLPPQDFAMSPVSTTTGVTHDGVARLQLDPNGHPMGGPVVVAPGAASPAASETGVVAYTRADDRGITRVFVQRPASIVRHRAVRVGAGS